MCGHQRTRLKHGETEATQTEINDFQLAYGRYKDSKWREVMPSKSGDPHEIATKEIKGQWMGGGLFPF